MAKTTKTTKAQTAQPTLHTQPVPQPTTAAATGVPTAAQMLGTSSVANRIVLAASTQPQGLTHSQIKLAIYSNPSKKNCKPTCNQLAGCPASKNGARVPYPNPYLQAVTYPGSNTTYFKLTAYGKRHVANWCAGKVKGITLGAGGNRVATPTTFNKSTAVAW